jgi:23S rRNA pseudouridine2457 synthase
MSFHYIAFHKPFEVLCQFSPSDMRITLKDFIPISGIYTAGRLDYRSEGLIILSDDGRFIHRITHPDHEFPKTYHAQVEGTITKEAIDRLNVEIVLPGFQTRLAGATRIAPPAYPERGKPVRDYHPTSWLQIELREGKKHQVRKMTAAVGYPTLRLIRIAIGPVVLGALTPGSWRRLKPDELRQFKVPERFIQSGKD